MIVYDYRSGFGLDLMLHRTLIPGFISASIALLVALEPSVKEYLIATLRNPAVYFSGVAFLISFVVVFRSQLAYGRFFGALTSYFKMKARLMDIATTTKALALPNTPEAILLKSTIFRWVKLYHKLALTRLRGGPVEDMFLDELVQEKELEILFVTRAKNQMVASWIIRAISENLSEFTAPPPIIGRLFQLSSDAEMEFGGALQVAETPFPFPYAQITVVLLNIWLITTPLVMTPFVSQSPFLAVFLAFISSWIIFAVNESAANLESPFDGDDNDIPLTYFDVVFDNAMMSIQYSPDPVFFKNESKCYIGTAGSKQMRRYLKTRVDRAGSAISDINHGLDSGEALGIVPRESRSGSLFKSSNWISTLLNKGPKAAVRSKLDVVEPEKPEPVRISKESTEVSSTSGTAAAKRTSKRRSSRKSAAADTDDVTVTIQVDGQHQSSDSRSSIVPAPMDTPRTESFASAKTVAMLFSPDINTAIKLPWRDRLPRFCCHNPISRMFARSKKSLRDMIADRVDSGTMRAQGNFTKYT